MISLMGRLLCTPRGFSLPLIGLFVVCVLCQSYPETAAAHHVDSSQPHGSCTTVAEVVPVSSINLLVGASTTEVQSHVSGVVLTSLAGLRGAEHLSRSISSQWDALSPPGCPALYCLNCTYRL